jgi:protein-S-isoprenylcysteine O-methyltransferase Ste14
MCVELRGVASAAQPAQGRPRRLSAALLFVLSAALGTSSLLLLLLFLLFGSPDLVDLQLGWGPSLALDGVLCFAFFVQHSGMVRAGFRRRLARFARAEYHAAIFSIASGIALLLLLVLWQDSGPALIRFEGAARWALRGVFGVAALGFAWSARALGGFDTFGLRAIRDHLRGRTPRETPFVVRGPYRWVRHPIYTCALLMLWSFPDVTADRLLFAAFWTVWTAIGTVLEERDLVETFGDDYRRYQREVPMLIPRRLPAQER